MPTFVNAIFVFALGACTGSFLNVVIYRRPAGLSIVKPASRCPKCEHKLAACDNVPILGWLWLRGKCRYCKTPISIQYPLIELITATLFTAVFLVYYTTGLQPTFATVGLWTPGEAFGTWPVLIVHLALIAMLIAATLIDFRHYIIPLEETWAVVVITAIVFTIAVFAGVVPTFANGQVTVVPEVTPLGFGAAAGGVAGLAVAVVLLRLGVLPRSFAEDVATAGAEGTDTAPPPHAADDPEDMIAHPHPRREVAKELLFLAVPVAGAAVGGVLSDAAAISPINPPWLAVLGGVALGYLFGGALVWVTRVLGTLGFGKEAMGLGDVHLLAAVGAVLGPVDATLVFFVAPFMGLLAVAATELRKVLAGSITRVIPYGPYLAGATVVVMVVGRVMRDELQLAPFFAYLVIVP